MNEFYTKSGRNISYYGIEFGNTIISKDGRSLNTLFDLLLKCFPKDRKYLSKCGMNCKTYLFKQLEIIKPKVVLCLGDAATKTILDIKYKKFSDVVGREFIVNEIKIIPIYHPSPVSPMSYKGNIEIFKRINLE